MGRRDARRDRRINHNNDPTARNYYEATEEAGVSYDLTLNWNVVPWWSAG